MDPAQFRVLDRMIEAADAGHTAAVAGTGKEARTTLAALAAASLVEVRGKKYFLTDAGRRSWEEHASAERRDEVQQARAAAEAQPLVNFLAAVQAQGGKPFTAAQVRKHAAAVREAAVSQKLVDAGPKTSAYTVRPEGETFVLRAQFQELWRDWDRLRRRVERASAAVVGTDALADLNRRTTDARAAFDAALTEYGALAAFGSVGQRVKESLDAAAREAAAQLDQQLATLRELQREMHGVLSDHDARLQLLRERIDARPAAAPPPPLAAAPEAVVWAATRQAYSDLYRQQALRGGIVKIPDLSDAVRAAIPGLSQVQFRDWLRQWQANGRLALQVCNDRNLEPRAAEGIESPHGLWFYVEIPE